MNGRAIINERENFDNGNLHNVGCHTNLVNYLGEDMKYKITTKEVTSYYCEAESEEEAKRKIDESNYDMSVQESIKIERVEVTHE